MEGVSDKEINRIPNCSKEVYEMEKDKDLLEFLRAEEREEKAKEKEN